MKTRIQVSLDERDSEALQRALSKLGCIDELQDRRRFVVRWAIRALAHAILREGRLPLPLAVELRPETEAETKARIDGDSPEFGDRIWFPS